MIITLSTNIAPSKPSGAAQCLTHNTRDRLRRTVVFAVVIVVVVEVRTRESVVRCGQEASTFQRSGVSARHAAGAGARWLIAVIRRIDSRRRALLLLLLSAAGP